MEKNYNRLEKHGYLVKLTRLITVPVLNFLPESTIKSFMIRSSKDASTVVAKGGTTHALEVMYNRYHRSLFGRGFTQGVADIFWHHVVSHPKALRNRLKIVKNVLKEKILTLINNNRQNISILSIAGGSSRSIMYTIQELRENHIDNPISVVTVDKDEAALRVGENLSNELGLGSNFEWVHDNASNVGVLFPGRKFDIIEIVGLLDYFDFNRSVRLLKMSKELMNDGGFIIIANVMHNSEESFIHKAGWPMMEYRKPFDVENILKTSGFKLSGDIIVEPMKIHCIGIGQK